MAWLARYNPELLQAQLTPMMAIRMGIHHEWLKRLKTPRLSHVYRIKNRLHSALVMLGRELSVVEPELS
jgi:hypothetical protein